MYFSLPASIRLGYALQASSPFCWLPKSSGIIYMYRRLALSLLLRCGTLCCVCECKGKAFYINKQASNMLIIKQIKREENRFDFFPVS